MDPHTQNAATCKVLTWNVGVHAESSQKVLFPQSSIPSVCCCVSTLSRANKVSPVLPYHYKVLFGEMECNPKYAGLSIGVLAVNPVVPSPLFTLAYTWVNVLGHGSLLSGCGTPWHACPTQLPHMQQGFPGTRTSILDFSHFFSRFRNNKCCQMNIRWKQNDPGTGGW